MSQPPSIEPWKSSPSTMEPQDLRPYQDDTNQKWQTWRLLLLLMAVTTLIVVAAGFFVAEFCIGWLNLIGNASAGQRH
ncbi:hypothetical protein [Rothia koreensis]|uniref:hypothetical protein n=1 Tax=Rothia koreensis TaxID=592378 RepID=UPI003FCD887D